MARHDKYDDAYIAKGMAINGLSESHFKERIIALRGVKLTKATVAELRARSYAIYHPDDNRQLVLERVEVWQWEVNEKLRGRHYSLRKNPKLAVNSISGINVK